MPYLTCFHRIYLKITRKLDLLIPMVPQRLPQSDGAAGTRQKRLQPRLRKNQHRRFSRRKVLQHLEDLQMLRQDVKHGQRPLEEWRRAPRLLAPWTGGACGTRLRPTRRLAGTSPVRLRDMRAAPLQVVPAREGTAGMRPQGRIGRQQQMPVGLRLPALFSQATRSSPRRQLPLRARGDPDGTRLQEQLPQ